jgi:hypothetical protein
MCMAIAGYGGEGPLDRVILGCINRVIIRERSRQTNHTFIGVIINDPWVVSGG